MEAALVDEFRLMVNPVAIGKGTPLFAGRGKPAKLNFIDSRVSFGGNLQAGGMSALPPPEKSIVTRISPHIRARRSRFLRRIIGYVLVGMWRLKLRRADAGCGRACGRPDA
jgi:hypothetical protein